MGSHRSRNAPGPRTGGARVTARPRVAVVIVSFNVREDLTRCLESIQAHPPAASHEIVVVDNASRDGSAAAVRERWPRVLVLQFQRNLGFAAATNEGIRATRPGGAPLILLLNPDTVVAAGTLDRLIDRLLAHPGVAAAGPRLVDGSGKVELSWGRMVGPFAELHQKVMTRLQQSGWRGATSMVERRTGKERFVDWVSGACLLVWRADAEAVGLLDERYFMYLEDVDFCAALRARGRRILFTPASEIVHLRGRARASAAAASEEAYRRAQVAFYEKHHPGWAALLRRYLRIRGKLEPNRT
jgi:N-acetylglucosaminyl-diphospho-decaprenol L-rhamnosyltransferase